MTSKTYEKALLALRSYQAAKSDNLDEILAIACVFRNRVMKFGKTYSQVLEEAEINRSWPSPNHPVMSDPNKGVLLQVDDIYEGNTPDLTSNHLQKNGAMHFGRVVDHQNTGDRFDTEILQHQDEHQLIGTFGNQQFFS